MPLEPDLDALLARHDVDVVVLATPPAGHHDQVLAAARAGRHLLVEKPMAQSVEECRSMVAAARDAGGRPSSVLKRAPFPPIAKHPGPGHWPA